MNSPIRNWSLRNRLTVGVLLLSAIGFIGAGLTSQFLLRSYLMSQVDEQLNSVIGGTTNRVNAAGIVNDEEVNPKHSGDTEHMPMRAAAPMTPLNRVPTSISVTVLDPFGNLIGGIGGDLNTNRIADYLQGMIPSQVASFGSEPFTVEAPGADFRVVTRVLPSAMGSVVVAQSLSDFERTANRIGRVFLIIGFIVLFLIGFAARQVIKLSMKPLEAVELTAEKIAAGDFSARLDNFEPDTEVGRLSSSLNTMLGRIEESFAIRTESEDKLRRFVADASHELRTPLTAIRGFAELHRQGAVPEGEKTKELISRIEKESIRMGALVEDLLLLARIDQSRQMEFKPVDLVHVIEETVASARAAGPDHPIDVAVPSELYTLGDSDRIYQVIANLLANARIHTPEGTAITVISRADDDGAYLSVADNGPGLSEADQKRIFERFFRADPSRQRNRNEGSGLGLSIVDAVMAAHGGKVSVTSKPGQGATFTLFFPNTKV
ncbi:MAG: HAMP domain-containing sensor histidine kinase [Candidatus Planktophila sp.]|nr:HAMP domain-containing sensor histidine kinase [Candidatus Planktophila sp.]